MEKENSRSYLWPFLKSEAKGLLISFLKPFWKTTLFATLVLAIYLAVRLWSSPATAEGYSPPDSVGGYFVEFPIIFVLSLLYVWPLGVIAGTVGTFWRFFGVFTFLPILLFLAALYGVFWVGSDFLLAQGHDVLEALKAASSQQTWEGLEGARVAHAGGPGAVIALIIILPTLLMGGLRIVFDPAVLWQLFQFLFCLVGYSFIAALASVLISSVPLAVTFVRRLKGRYQACKQAQPSSP